MLMIKKKVIIILSMLTLFTTIIIIDVDSVSAETNIYYNEQYIENETQNVNDTFLEVYNSSKNLSIDSLETEEQIYAFLIHNKNNVLIDSTGQLVIKYNDITNFEKLSAEEGEAISNFVARLNSLVVNQAISIDENLVFSIVQNIEHEFSFRSQAVPLISIMHTTRKNKNTLKTVFSNAPFRTKHAVAGLYFAQRVRTGGIWDMKAQLGTNRSYYIEDLGTTMTGEAIGNFHYGYVGRAVFSATTLKSAAGMYQIISKTSSVKYYSSFFDDPRDQAQIQRGIDMYNREH